MKKEKESKNGISRRELIKITGVGVGAATLGGLGSTGVGAHELSVTWDKETEVLIIGSGFAGLAAAIEASDAKASVTILEKMPIYGGNSIIAAGVYNCVDPDRQRAQGIKDSIDLHYEQTIDGGDYRPDPERVRYIVEHALEGWQWLERMGVELTGPIYQIYGALWPRSHRPKYKDKIQGAAIVAALYDQVKARRIPILLEHKVTKVLRSQPLEGRIMGVEVEANGKRLNFKAKRALVIASGGFCADVEMRMRHDPRFDARFIHSNHNGATGETLIAAQDVGADVTGLCFIQSGGPSGLDIRYVTPPVGIVPRQRRVILYVGSLSVDHIIYTDLRGKRIVAADTRRDYITDAILRTPEKVVVAIGDAESPKYSMYGPTPPGVLDRALKEHPKEIFKADTIRGLAEKIGMSDPSILVETVTKYNSFVDAKKDPEFGQLPQNLIWKCEKAPFWAATGSPAVHHMCGGLRTKPTTAQVLDRSNKIIPGFYAAGEITGGMHGTNRLGGNATTDCIVFGRVAGKNAAAESPWG